MIELKFVTIGDDVGLPLPDELLARHGLRPGDVMYLREEPRGFVLSVRPPPDEAHPNAPQTPG